MVTKRERLAEIENELTKAKQGVDLGDGDSVNYHNKQGVMLYGNQTSFYLTWEQVRKLSAYVAWLEQPL